MPPPSSSLFGMSQHHSRAFNAYTDISGSPPTAGSSPANEEATQLKHVLVRVLRSKQSACTSSWARPTLNMASSGLEQHRIICRTYAEFTMWVLTHLDRDQSGSCQILSAANFPLTEERFISKPTSPKVPLVVHVKCNPTAYDDRLLELDRQLALLQEGMELEAKRRSKVLLGLDSRVHQLESQLFSLSPVVGRTGPHFSNIGRISCMVGELDPPGYQQLLPGRSSSISAVSPIPGKRMAMPLPLSSQAHGHLHVDACSHPGTPTEEGCTWKEMFGKSWKRLVSTDTISFVLLCLLLILVFCALTSQSRFLVDVDSRLDSTIRDERNMELALSSLQSTFGTQLTVLRNQTDDSFKTLAQLTVESIRNVRDDIDVMMGSLLRVIHEKAKGGQEEKESSEADPVLGGGSAEPFDISNSTRLAHGEEKTLTTDPRFKLGPSYNSQLSEVDAALYHEDQLGG